MVQRDMMGRRGRGRGGGTGLEPQPVRGQGAALLGESYPGNTGERESGGDGGQVDRWLTDPETG